MSAMPATRKREFTRVYLAFGAVRKGANEARQASTTPSPHLPRCFGLKVAISRPSSHIKTTDKFATFFWLPGRVLSRDVCG